MALLAYTGARPEHRPGSSTPEYGPDNRHSRAAFLKSPQAAETRRRYMLTGDWGYSFNSLGYRGPEFDAQAEIRLYAVGCSNTLGVGVRWEQSWPFLVGRKLARQAAPSRLCLMNFSQGSASNDYIARTALAQCRAERPDLLLVHFTGKARKEHVSEDRLTNLLPTGDLSDEASAYYALYSEEEGVINALKNILLVQFFCRSEGIPYLFAWSHHRVLSGRYRRDPICGPLVAAVDQSRFVPLSVRDPEIAVDHGRDLLHPGPRSHARFADLLFGKHEKLAGR